MLDGFFGPSGALFDLFLEVAEGEFGVLGGEFDEAEAFTALRDFDSDGRSAAAAEPLLDDLFLFDFDGEEDFAGDFRGVGIVLLDELLHGFLGCGFA